VQADIELWINGEAHRLAVDTRTTLLDLLREHLGLTGAKKGCDHGQCGACTVLLDDRRANACLALAVAHDGAELVTVEGLAAGDELHPLQSAFVERDAFQCGYCTPGQLCSAAGMIAEAQAEGVELDDPEIRERMSGNLCRCGAYPNIVAAIRDVAAGAA
jgi:xanthine dehydrogenase YagT iron-sulfur-binding subunit